MNINVKLKEGVNVIANSKLTMRNGKEYSISEDLYDSSVMDKIKSVFAKVEKHIVDEIPKEEVKVKPVSSGITTTDSLYNMDNGVGNNKYKQSLKKKKY